MPQEAKNFVVNLKEHPDILRKLERYNIAVKNPELTSDELERIINQLDTAIEEKKRFSQFNLLNLGDHSLFTKLAKLVLIGSATLAVHITQRGIGALPTKEQNERSRLNLFSFDLIFHSLLKTGTLKTTIGTIVDMVGTNEKGKIWLTNLLELLALGTGIIAASKVNKDETPSLIESFAPDIEKRIVILEKLIEEALANGSLEGNLAQGALLFLQQSKLALEKGDPDNLFKAYSEVITLLGISSEEILSEIKNFEHLAETLSYTFNTGIDEVSGQETTIHHV